MKIFQREQRSLFGEILDWMLTPLLLLWPVSLALTWLVAQSIAGKPFDRALEYNVQALAQLVDVQQQRVVFNLPQPAREILRADDSDLVYYQVLGAHGELLSGERDLPLPARGRAAARRAKCGCATTRCAGRTCASPTPGSSSTCRARQPSLVQVAETREKRSVLATEIIKGVMLPQFVDPAAGGAAGVAGAGARHQAAVAAGGAHPRAQAGRPEPAGRQDGAAGGGAAGVCRSTTC